VLDYLIPNASPVVNGFDVGDYYNRDTALIYLSPIVVGK
jgi:hypothetical protein